MKEGSSGRVGVVKGDGLETTTKTKDEMESGFLLDVVVLEGTAILELLAGEDKTLLIRRNTFLVLDLLLHGFNGIGVLDFKGDCLASQSLDKNLH